MKIVPILAIAAMTATAAAAHDAPSGWQYENSCCSNRDCRELSASEIGEVWNGYHIKISTQGEIVPYRSPKIKDSPDGHFHWCSHGGLNSGGTICLYVPPRGY
jgi:hypothetical protein